MKNKTNRFIFMFFVIISLLSIYVVGCGQTPEIAEAPPTTPLDTAANTPAEIPVTAPVETPVTTPVDTPTMSEEEACAYIWSRLPALLPDEYDITQFSVTSKKAEYIGEGKWSFSVSGSESNIKELPPEIVEKSEDYWVEQKTCEVATCDLLLSTVYYERTNIIDDVRVLRSNITTKTETDETPVRKEFRLDYIQLIIQSVHSVEIGCGIENTGRVPLKNLKLVIYIVQKEGDILLYKTVVNIEPSIIERREKGKVFEKVAVEEIPLNADAQYFSYAFLTASGSPFEKYPSTPGEKDKFYHAGSTREPTI